jgi:hypothetical protein
MKSNEAPEKIYITECMLFATNPEITLPKNNSIEYTNTDAFIEKATSYIQQHWIWNTKMIEDFKNYMKGE